MEKEIRTRSWTWTSYILNEEHIQSLDCDYIIYGREECPTTQKKHLQGFIHLANTKTMSAVKKLFNDKSLHLEPAKGSAEQNRVYCIKDGDFFEKGDMPKQGKRNDLEKIREIVKSSGKMRDVVEIATSYQSVKMAEQILKYHEPKRVFTADFKIYWFHGETGSGKTKTAYEMAGDDYYVCLNTGKWWDGYDGHKTVIIDDFRSNFCCFAELLKILQPYEYRVETKGGTRQLLATIFFITSPYPPDAVYQTREDIKQLIRRIMDIKEFFSQPIV